MITVKEFSDKQHYFFCKNEYESARHYLKTCGKPEDWYDRFIIDFNKETATLFKKYSG